MSKKPKPLCYFESHAGGGLYACNSAEALKTGEFAAGFGRLRGHTAQHPLLADYLKLVQDLQKNAATQHYPGSPLIAQTLLRPQDELILCELHPQAVASLKTSCGRDRRTHLHQRDGLAALKALLPPQASRGLVLIDPAYEVKQDYAAVTQSILDLQRRFRAATVALWYPRLPQNPAQNMLKQLKQRSELEFLDISLDVTAPTRDFGMFGSGMLIFQPPWQLDTELRPALAEAATLMSPHPQIEMQTSRS